MVKANLSRKGGYRHNQNLVVFRISAVYRMKSGEPKFCVSTVERMACRNTCFSYADEMNAKQSWFQVVTMQPKNMCNVVFIRNSSEPSPCSTRTRPVSAAIYRYFGTYGKCRCVPATKAAFRVSVRYTAICSVGMIARPFLGWASFRYNISANSPTGHL